MMIGREESMPNNVREPDLTSEEREIARRFAMEILRDVIGGAQLQMMAKAVLRYVPAGIPAAAPHPVAAADDMTRPSSAEARCDECDPSFGCFASPSLCRKRPLSMSAGVICEPIEEESSGVVEPSDDGETRRVGDLGLTRAIDISDDSTRR